MKSVLPVTALLPLYGIVVTLRFNRAVTLAFFHQPALTAFIRGLAGSPDQFDQFIRLDVPESCRQSYQNQDLYRFSLFGIKDCLPLMQRIITGLKGLPHSAPDQSPDLAFGQHCQLEDLQDLFAENSLSSLAALQPYRHADLTRESELWLGQPQVRLCFYSPVRWLKAKALRTGLKGEARYCRQYSDLSGRLVADRFYDGFADLLKKHGQTELPARSTCQPLSFLDSSHLFWLDADYLNRNSRKRIPMGGMLGELVLSAQAFSVDFWHLLILAQYTGVGQRCTFGWGRFQLQSQADELSCRRVFPAASLLTRIASEDNLLAAFEHVDQSSTQSMANEEADEALLERLETDIERIYQGNFTAPDLQGFIIDKSDGNPRALAVPPFRDRVLQRAVAQILTPLLDSMQYQHSYGFRPGRSRITARYAIQSAWREGYRWVYESDIDDFFDSVCWQRLGIRLRALWGIDPLVDCVMAWMQADVFFEGQTIQRRQGLPQGSPLSPLLANLMLDDFDNDMQAAGFKLIRYADDFIVLCKSVEQAEKAHQASVQSLKDHGLSLNSDKTNITEMDQGFHYLGYLFVNDMALESPRRLRNDADQAGAEPEVAANSWLARFGAMQAKAIDPPDNKPEPETPASSEIQPPDSLRSFGNRRGSGLLLCLTGSACVLSTADQRLQVSRDDDRLYDVPWRHLQAVVLLGRHHMTSPAMRDSLQFNVPVHFCSSSAKYEGVLWSGQPASKGHALWLRQQAVFEVRVQALSAAKVLVTARLSHIRETLRLRRCQAEVKQLAELLKKVSDATNLAELNGLEGVATRLYFQCLTQWLPSEFAFNGRNRRPPRDPFNALLSLGYTLLYSCVDSLLRVDGLLPWCGFYHQPRGRHAALASDLMEPFRHIIERLALALVKRHELSYKDFYFDSSGACFLKKQARGFFLSQVMAKFDSKLLSRNQSDACSLFEHIHWQNLELIRWIEHGGEFLAWRVR